MPPLLPSLTQSVNFQLTKINQASLHTDEKKTIPTLTSEDRISPLAPSQFVNQITSSQELKEGFSNSQITIT